MLVNAPFTVALVAPKKLVTASVAFIVTVPPVCNVMSRPRTARWKFMLLAVNVKISAVPNTAEPPAQIGPPLPPPVPHNAVPLSCESAPVTLSDIGPPEIVCTPCTKRPVAPGDPPMVTPCVGESIKIPPLALW